MPGQVRGYDPPSRSRDRLVARREKNSRLQAQKKTAGEGLMAACERCGAEFKVTHPWKRFCSERCQRQGEKERYRARHTEQATCKHCGGSFRRVVIGRRKKVYCSLACQYEAKSIAYQTRADVKANLRRARRIRARKAGQGRSVEILW